MKESLSYLLKDDINKELDSLIFEELIHYKNNIGKKCNICGIVQGNPYYGWNKYFCIHIEKEIDKKVKEEKEKITKEAIQGLTLIIKNLKKKK